MGVSIINKKAPVRRLFFYSYIIKILQNIPSIKGITFYISKTNIIESINNKSLAATAFSLRESFARRHGRVGDFLPNDGSRAPKVQGGVNGYLSVM